MKKNSVIIDIKNKNEIDNLYIHDTFINKIEINHPKREATLFIKGYKKRKYIIGIEGVLLIECEYLNLWRSTDYKVLDIFLYNDDIEQEISIKEQKGNKRIIQNINNEQSYVRYEGSKELIKIGIELDSGDIIKIICEKVIFTNLSSPNALYDYNK